MKKAIPYKTKRVYTAICALLVCITVFSAIITGTFAWNKDLNWINEFIGEKHDYTVTLQKYERDIFGEATTSPIKDAEFYLYDENDAQIGGRYVTDENGKINISGIKPGNYYFLETNPGYAYTYDNDGENEITKYYFTILNTDTNIVVHAFNRKVSADLIITKEVENADGMDLTDEQLAQEFEFTVTFSDNGSYPYTINGVNETTLASGGTLKLKHGDKALFTGLPVGVQYTVTETPVTGYYASSTNHQGNIPAQGAQADFINLYRPGESFTDDTSLTVKKVVEGEVPEADRDREFNFTVIIDGVETRFTLKYGEEKTFALPIGAVYEVIEEDYFTDGYILSSVTNGSGTVLELPIECVFTNTYIGIVYIDISGEKTWDMSADTSAAKPESITLYLKNGDTVVDTATVTPDGNGKWEYTFTAPKYDADGNEITYTVEEKPIEGFISEVSGYYIKNTYVKPAVFAPAVEKLVTGDTPDTSADFSFNLTAIDGAPMPDGSEIGTKTITISGNGTNNFGNISFTKAGVYTYTISEVKGSADGYTYDESLYTLTVTVELQGSELIVKSAVFTKTGDSKTYDKAVFTNTYTPPGTVSVKVAKEWAGTNPNQPASVQVQLYKDGAAYGTPVTLNQANNWTHIWTELDKDAVWTVDEPNVPADYTKQITGDADTGFTITNTFDEVVTPPDTGTVIISGSKTWNHGTNPEASQPKSITIILRDQYGIVLQKEISEANHWSWRFEVDKYDPDGNEYIYTIDEVAVPGYTKYIDGYNITNNHESYEEITIAGQKYWEHGTNEAKRPDSITVQIKNGDKIVAEKVVTAADGWKYTFVLPKHDENGKEINYTVSEANVPYYTMTPSGNNMTNTFKGYNYPGDLPKTGDNSNIWLWVSLMIAGATMLVITVVIGKKKKTGKYCKRTN